jgi:hypothetical protein
MKHTCVQRSRYRWNERVSFVGYSASRSLGYGYFNLLPALIFSARVRVYISHTKDARRALSQMPWEPEF